MALTHGRHETPTRNEGTVIDFEDGQGTAPRRPVGRQERRGHRRLIVGGALAGVGAAAVAVVAAVSGGGGTSKPAHRAVQRQETAPAASGAPQPTPEQTTPPSTAALAPSETLSQSFANVTVSQLCGDTAVKATVSEVLGAEADCTPGTFTAIGNFAQTFTASNGNTLVVTIAPIGKNPDPVKLAESANPYLPVSNKREEVSFDGVTGVSAQQSEGEQTGFTVDDGSQQDFLEITGLVGGQNLHTGLAVRAAHAVVRAVGT